MVTTGIAADVLSLNLCKLSDAVLHSILFCKMERCGCDRWTTWWTATSKELWSTVWCPSEDQWWAVLHGRLHWEQWYLANLSVMSWDWAVHAARRLTAQLGKRMDAERRGRLVDEVLQNHDWHWHSEQRTAGLEQGTPNPAISISSYKARGTKPLKITQLLSLTQVFEHIGEPKGTNRISKR